MMPMRSQSALEYLTTYGWALLIIAIVFFVLFELNVLNVGNQGYALPGSCSVVSSGTPGTNQFLSFEGTCNGAVPKFVSDLSNHGYVTTPNMTAFHNLNSFTVIVWVARKGSTGTTEPVLASNGTILPNFDLLINESGSNSATFGAMGASGYSGAASSSSNSLAALQDWYFLAGTYNTSSVSIYVDGALAGSSGTTLSGLSANGNITAQIGHSYSSPLQYFDGYVTNVQIYDRQLSPSEIQTTFREGIGGLPIDLNGLVAWYPLNGNPNDYSQAKLNGMATNVIYSSSWLSTTKLP
ncbi:MAG: LamG domain-containing protein [Candidatus Micrarchaeales archaeon]|nr:LamG domain-containing protein [Candidatus Micrarchaeales archaeon]